MSIHPYPSTLLSAKGSDRATAYITSNKIIRRDGRLFIGWLDAPAEQGQLATIRMGVCDAKTGALEKIVTLGRGFDNHCGPALAMDGSGRAHAILGAHHNPFLYRWSDTPDDETSWSEPIVLGPFDTYPSLAIDKDGTLHLIHRRMDDRWQLWYRRKRQGQPWEVKAVLAQGPLPGYNHFYQSLSIGPTGTLHLVFHFNYTETGLSAHTKGRIGVYMKSDDGGETWFNEGTHCKQPVTIESANAICRYPDGGLRISNHVVDDGDRPCFFATVPGRDSGVLLRRSDSGWEEVALPGEFQRLNFIGGRETSLSRDAGGTIHLVTGTHGETGESRWYDPRHEIVHLALSPKGSEGRVTQITNSGPSIANWLPALENWSWLTPIQDSAPALAFCRGTAGGAGENINARKTEVHLIATLPAYG